jgi:succinate dehydrogenase flavin-adding protein (antitoxin of CptAB toxin-antitoxin module)
MDKRSPKQLKSYWLLIMKVTNFMNRKGNHFTPSQVDQYFKLLSDHYDLVLGQKLTKSIANKSDCTKEQMERLITEILKFGAENDIADCFIRDDELTALLKFYE